MISSPIHVYQDLVARFAALSRGAGLYGADAQTCNHDALEAKSRLMTAVLGDEQSVTHVRVALQGLRTQLDQIEKRLPGNPEDN